MMKMNMEILTLLTKFWCTGFVVVFGVAYNARAMLFMMCRKVFYFFVIVMFVLMLMLNSGFGELICVVFVVVFAFFVCVECVRVFDVYYGYGFFGWKFSVFFV